MKKLLFVFLLGVMAISTQAQQNLDSLWAVWNNTSQADTSRLKAMRGIANAYHNQPDSGLYFSQLQYNLAESRGYKKWMANALQDIGVYYGRLGNSPEAMVHYSRSLKISKDIKDKKGIAYSLNSIGTMYSKQGDNAKAIDYYTRSLKIKEEIGDKKGMGGSLINIGIIYKGQGDYPQAIDYCTRGLKICEEINEKEFMVKALDNIGVTYRILGDYTEALDYSIRSLKIKEEIGHKLGIAYSLNNIGIIYKDQGDYAKTIDHFTRSLKIKEEIGDKKGIAGSLVNIGVIYHLLGDYAKAIDYYTRSLKIKEEIGEKMGIAIALDNIGITYRVLGDYTEALDYSIRSLKIKEEIGDKMGMANSLNSIGRVYKDQGDYAKAIDYYTRSLKIREEIGDKNGIALSLKDIGIIFYAQGDYRTAISYGSRSLAHAKEMGNVASIKNAAGVLHVSYTSTGQYRKALEMQTLYFRMRDSLNSEENQKAAIQQQFKYEYEKQKALDDLENEKQLEIEREKQEKQRLLSAAVGTGFLLVLLLAFGLWNRNRFIKKTNTQLGIAKDRAERSEKYKEQFLANMSHEIRTPMHAISGMVKILKRNEHSAAQEIFLSAMHQSSDNLLVILNDILDLSKIEAGKLDVESIPMEPATVIKNVSQILKYKAEEKGLQLEVKIDPDVPNWIMGDPTRLNQILTNLAGNAIKFTERGRVHISAKRKNEFVVFEVQDTGIGIPEHKLQSIFEAFGQAETSTTRQFGGTGLGLSISQQLVEMQGGNIWAESETGKGSTFFVSLPLIPVAEKAISQTALTEDQIHTMAAALKGSRILLAEDNAFNQMIAQDDLRFYIEDVQIEVAENGVIAVEKFQTGNYDLILMDVQMPEMDGYEATLKIREWEKTKGKKPVPIIAMTASLLKSEINLCFEAGMDNYIPKPYQAEELVGAMYEEVKGQKRASNRFPGQ